MKKTKENTPEDDELDEYDFFGMKGVREKHHKVNKVNNKDNTVRIHKGDGIVTLEFTLPDEKFRRLDEASADLNITPDEMALLAVEKIISPSKNLEEIMGERTREITKGHTVKRHKENGTVTLKITLSDEEFHRLKEVSERSNLSPDTFAMHIVEFIGLPSNKSFKKKANEETKNYRTEIIELEVQVESWGYPPKASWNEIRIGGEVHGYTDFKTGKTHSYQEKDTVITHAVFKPAHWHFKVRANGKAKTYVTCQHCGDDYAYIHKIFHRTKLDKPYSECYTHYGFEEWKQLPKEQIKCGVGFGSLYRYGPIITQQDRDASERFSKRQSKWEKIEKEEATEWKQFYEKKLRKDSGIPAWYKCPKCSRAQDWMVIKRTKSIQDTSSVVFSLIGIILVFFKPELLDSFFDVPHIWCFPFAIIAWLTVRLLALFVVFASAFVLGYLISLIFRIFIKITYSSSFKENG